MGSALQQSTLNRALLISVFVMLSSVIGTGYSSGISWCVLVFSCVLLVDYHSRHLAMQKPVPKMLM